MEDPAIFEFQTVLRKPEEEVFGISVFYYHFEEIPALFLLSAGKERSSV